MAEKTDLLIMITLLKISKGNKHKFQISILLEEGTVSTTVPYLFINNYLL